MSDDLARTRRTATKLKLPQLERHILLCSDTKRSKCASKKEMKKAAQFLSKRLKELGMKKSGQVRISKCDCFDICRGGPIAVVHPDNIWYGQCDPDVLERILQEHVIGGQPVEEYIVAQPDCADRCGR